MEDFYAFVLSHWKYIALAVAYLVLLIVSICKKTKFTDNTLLSVMAVLPTYILEAEQLQDKSKKYSYVFAKAISYICALTGLDERVASNKYALFLDEAIEKILEAPHKKGD